MKRIIMGVLYQLRYTLPLWFVQLLTNWLPENRIVFRLRGILVSPFLGSCGRNLTLGTGVMFLNPHGIHLGNNVYMATGCWIDGIGDLKIEDEVKLSPYVVIATSSHCFKDNSVRFGGSRTASVHIGRGSWLASHVTVVAGCSVGAGCIIGSNAVVSRNVPDNVFAGGVPAKIIGPREDKEPTVFSRADILK